METLKFRIEEVKTKFGDLLFYPMVFIDNEWEYFSYWPNINTIDFGQRSLNTMEEVKKAVECFKAKYTPETQEKVYHEI